MTTAARARQLFGPASHRGPGPDRHPPRTVEDFLHENREAFR